MCIAKHLKKRNTISTDAKEYPHNRWNAYLSYKLLRKKPKFSDDVTIGNSSPHIGKFEEVDEDSEHEYEVQYTADTSSSSAPPVNSKKWMIPESSMHDPDINAWSWYDQWMIVTMAIAIMDNMLEVPLRFVGSKKLNSAETHLSLNLYISACYISIRTDQF